MLKTSFGIIFNVDIVIRVEIEIIFQTGQISAQYVPNLCLLNHLKYRIFEMTSAMYLETGTVQFAKTGRGRPTILYM